MACDNQHSPSQAGADMLKFCETARKVLCANIDPFASLVAKTEAKVKIRAMDYNELRAALIALQAG